jgi:hypothetical protein
MWFNEKENGSMPRKDSNGNEIGKPRSVPRTADTPRWNFAQQQEPVEWSAIDHYLIGEVVAAVTSKGDAVLFGSTSDGGALVLSVLSNPPTPKTYFKPSDDVEYALRSLVLAYKDEK